MDKDIKNLFEYLKEIYSLRTKIITDYKKFDKTIDTKEFDEKYSEIADTHKFSEKLNLEEEYFVIKYISKANAIPKVPAEIKEYITVNEDEINITPSTEIPVELRDKVNKYKAEFKEIKAKNALIEKYNELYEYFFEVNNRKEEFEEKIEVILGRGLFVYKPKNGSVIRRHVFEVPLVIDIKQTNNTIYLRLDKEAKASIEYNFMPTIDFKVKDREGLLQLKSDYEEKYLVGDEIDFNELYDSYLNHITFKYECLPIISEEEIEEEKAYIFENDSIIVRKKQPTVWMDDLTAIVDKINKNEFKPENTLPFLILEKNDEKINEYLSSKEEKNRRVLFPLPSNDEQYMVVKQTEDSNIVLVQGPPGTGKSHTIANLISNYVSEGKRILITSEKSKALEVVKGKLPEGIRDLSMALLSDTQNSNELSNSIQIVLDRYKDKDYLNEYEKRIEELETKLDEITNQKQKNHDEIIEILLSNSEDYKDKINVFSQIESDNYRLIDIAKFLNSKKELDYIEDENNYAEAKFDKEFLLDLETIIDDLRDYKEYIVDKEYELPKDIDLDEYQRIIESIGDTVKIQKGEIDEKNLNNYDIKMLVSVLGKIINLEKLYTREYIKDNCEYKPRTENIKRIIDSLNEDKDFYEKTETELIGQTIEYDNKNRANIKEALAKIGEVVADGKISLIEKMKYKKEIELVGEVSINGEKIKDDIKAEKTNAALNKLKYDTKVAKTKADIISVLPQSELLSKIDDCEFSRTIGYLIDTLETFNNYKVIVGDLTDALKDIYRSNDEVKKLIDEEEYEKIYDEITKAKEYSNYVESKSNYNDELEQLESKTSKTRDVFRGVLEAIREKNIEKFNAEKNKIEKIYELDESYNKLKKRYPYEALMYPLFISRFISMDEQERKNVTANFNDVLNYYKLKMFFIEKEKSNEKLDVLFKEKEKLNSEEKEIIVKTIEEKSWYNQIKNMTNVTCKALSNWLSLRTKLGKGTGKRANTIRREMQEQMQTAKDAIPIWIMPLDKIIEQYPYSNEAQFDVLIMDESSQSSVMSITALLRAKKCIIVGDDKQISPVSVGVTVESIKDLQSKYLKETCLGVGFDMDTSIYDLIQNVCGSKKVVLKEHFRCLPEIIEFSNIYFYGNQINCLKVRGKNNTIKEPIKTYYLEDGMVSDSTSANIINKQEVNKIIDVLNEISNDETYDDKTIGIIVLQNSNAQAKAITTAIWQNFDNDFIKQRKIKVGNSYEFQGDERDVIILSMVISKKQTNGEERIVKAFTTKEYERSFNVAASRGKEQMILIYSIKPSELSSECLRYKLITYYTTYNADKKTNAKSNFETDFEKDIFDELSKRDVKLIPHFKIGKYEVDLAYTDETGRMIGIECDGDRSNTKENFEIDLKEQDVLARCGWEFIRVRASKYYCEPEKTIEEIIQKL